jgi:hypothetical protein
VEALYECTAICGVYVAGEYLTTLRSKVQSARGPSARKAYEALEKKCAAVMRGYSPVHIDGNRFLPGDKGHAPTLKNSCVRIKGAPADAAGRRQKCTAICGVYFAGKYFTTLRSKIESAEGPSPGEAFQALEKKCGAYMKGYIPVHTDGNRFLPGDDAAAATPENSCEEE